ncbi:hypothetical protein [Sphingomonas sp. NPDC079357]|uniref:hypothetical protein n=1 Tax=Sphingomonas sp. NPDC079357 TaxID=3364518 RepID=UPI00384F8AD1
MNSLSPLASPLSTMRSVTAARPAALAVAAPVAAPDATPRAEPSATSTGSLIRTAGEQLDQFDRVMEKLRASMNASAVTYGGNPALGQTGQIVDRLG